MKAQILILGILGMTLGCSSEDSSSTQVDKAREESLTTQEGAGNLSSNPAVTGSQNASPDANDESASAPKQVSGAYMTAQILPQSASDTTIRVGIIGMLDDVRLSNEREKYKSTWTLDFSEVLPVSVTLTKSADPDYDQVLEFHGNQEQFRQYLNAIAVSLQFQQNLNGSIVSSVVVDKLDELLP